MVTIATIDRLMNRATRLHTIGALTDGEYIRHAMWLGELRAILSNPACDVYAD